MASSGFLPAYVPFLPGCNPASIFSKAKIYHPLERLSLTKLMTHWDRSCKRLASFGLDGDKGHVCIYINNQSASLGTTSSVSRLSQLDSDISLIALSSGGVIIAQDPH